MHQFGSDIVLDLHQYHGFDYVGWVRGEVRASPVWVLCMVEGLPFESRYKTLALPNPRDEPRELVMYQASRAHEITLLAQLLLSWSGDQVEAAGVVPPWIGLKSDESEPEVQGLSELQRLNAQFLQGVAAQE